MIDRTEADERVELKEAPRVTEEYIQTRIADVGHIQVPGTTMTICRIELDNGFAVVGKSACVSEENFDPEVGQRYAFDDAFDQLPQYFGMLLAEANYQRKVKAAKAETESNIRELIVPRA